MMKRAHGDVMQSDAEPLVEGDQPTILSRVLKWLPLALATLLVLGGVLAVVTAPMGHDEDLVAQGKLLASKRAEADAAEKDFSAAYDQALDDASVVSPQRLHGDALAMRELLTAVVVDRNPVEPLTSHKVPADAQLAKFAAAVEADGVPGVTGEAAISDFSPVLTRISATAYTWFVVAEVRGDDGAAATLTLTLTADSTGGYTSAEAHWVDGLQHS